MGRTAKICEKGGGVYRKGLQGGDGTRMSLALLCLFGGCAGGGVAKENERRNFMP